VLKPNAENEAAVRQLAKKLLHLGVVLFAVSLGTFMLLKLTPGDPAVEVLGQQATPAAIQQLHHQMGLDRPLATQYAHWIMGALHGDLGKSLALPGGPVSTRIAQALPVTVELAILAQLIALAVAIPLGTFAAYKAGGRFDAIVNSVSSALISTPAFLAGLLLAYLFAVQLHVFPRTQWVRISDDFWGNLHSAILPAITLSLTEIAIYTRILRGDMISTLQSEFIAAARSRGLPTWRVLSRHAFRLSSLSLVTLSALGLARLIGGAAIVEVIFALPGIGQMLITAIGANDFPLVQGTVLVVATAYVMLNFLIDFSYGFLDPRIRRAT
jgi:peptide/nickel transport system permease protein